MPTPVLIYQDEYLLVVNKPAGMPTQPDKTADVSVLDWAQTTFGSVHLVHRLDRPVSGILLLARSAEMMDLLSGQWQRQSVTKEYFAVVQPLPPNPEGDLVHYIRKKGGTNTSSVFNEPRPEAERAELHYKVLESSTHYHLVQINLITGRHHQIRAQMAAIGCPIKGDVKYGARRANPDRSIHLHARRLSFLHPITREQMDLSAALPEDRLWGAFFSVSS